MRKISLKLINIFLLIIGFLPSCSLLNEDDCENAHNRNEPNDVWLDLSLTKASIEETGLEIEDVYSLRILLINESGILENNLFINNSQDAGKLTFPYSLRLLTTTGKKHLYIIANEKSVADYNFESDETKPSKSISEWFDGFNEGSSGIEDKLKDLYFKPDYNKPIPLSCFYEIDLQGNYGDELEKDVYLVNVGTRFYIRFNNYRNEEVIFDKVALNSVADLNYLIPQIGESDLNKDGIYWIDWLKDVVEETQKYPGLDDSDTSNDVINEKWGWLNDYRLPKKTEHKIVNFNTSPWTVPKSILQESTIPKPETLVVFPLYLPESKNIISGGNSQKYTLEFEIRNNAGPPHNISYELTNLKSLFRDTYVIINVDIVTIVENIYVEIKNWSYRDNVYGIITPE